MCGDGVRTDEEYVESDKFDNLRRVEIKQIETRRSGIENLEGRSDDPNNDLSGLALSGGGIRSAIFCLGVCQALARHGVLKHMDYLSTVSGGGYMGGSLSWFWSGKSGNPTTFGMDAEDFPYGVEKPYSVATPERNRLLTYLRSHGNYLTPGNGIGFSAFTSVVIRGTFLNLIVWLPLMAALWFAVLGVEVFLLKPALSWVCACLWDVCSAWVDPNSVGPGQSVTAASLLLAGAILVISVICACLYSLFTRISRIGFTRWNVTRANWKTARVKYCVRRFFESLSGALLKTFILLLLLAGVPQADRIARWAEEAAFGDRTLGAAWALGGSGAFIVAGLVLGYLAYSKASEKGLKPIMFGALGICLFTFGVFVFSFDLASLIFRHVVGVWWPGQSAGSEWVVYVAIAGALFALVLGWYVNINYISVHRYYRDRLMEAFMPDYATARDNKTCAAFSANDAALASFAPDFMAKDEVQADDEAATNKDTTQSDVSVQKEQDTESPKTNPARPYHLINTNLILPDTENSDLKNWKASNFVLSPLYCGSTATGWRKTETFMDARLTLPTSVAISGAAANPSAGPGGGGLTANPLISLIMAFLNLRLGSWVPNPRFDDMQSGKPNHFSPGLYQLFGMVKDRYGLNEERKFLQISDGGHFENLALYELIRRKVRVILCCDGGCDPEYRFDDLRNLIQRVGQDFGTEVIVGPKELRRVIPKVHDDAKGATFPQKLGYADHGYFLAKIRYSDNSSGLLIYMKTTMLEGLDVRTLGYKMAHKDFPDETTVDQFFSEDQFDAYRDLGFLTAEKMLSDIDLRRDDDYADYTVPAWLRP